MTKIITISKIGYNHPSQANWSYSIWKIDLVDTVETANNKYAMSYIVKETFGGDSRLRKLYPQIIETKGVYTGTGTQKITGIAKLPDIESDEIKTIINDFINS